MILVIGATGTVGKALVERLARRGEPVRAATRAPDAKGAGVFPYVEHAAFDFDRPDTYASVLAGVERAFLMARPGDEEADRTAVPLIEAMKRQGVRCVVDLSAMGAEKMEGAALRKVERHLEGSGLAYTHLRPNWFMQIFATGPLLAAIRAIGAIQVPAANARISFVDSRDIADVAVEALCGAGHESRAYTLTGGEALDHGDVAEALTQASGRPIRYVPISEEDAARALGAAGLPLQRIERLMGFYRLVRQGFSAPVSPDIEAVLGRPPRSFTGFAGDHADRWSATHP